VEDRAGLGGGVQSRRRSCSPPQRMTTACGSGLPGTTGRARRPDRISEHRGPGQVAGLSGRTTAAATGCDDRKCGSTTGFRRAARGCCTGTPTGCNAGPHFSPAAPGWPARAKTTGRTTGDPGPGGAQGGAQDSRGRRPAVGRDRVRPFRPTVLATGGVTTARSACWSVQGGEAAAHLGRPHAERGRARRVQPAGEPLASAGRRRLRPDMGNGTRGRAAGLGHPGRAPGRQAPDGP